MKLLGEALQWTPLQLHDHVVQPLITAAMTRVGVPQQFTTKVFIDGLDANSTAAIDSIISGTFDMDDLETISSMFDLDLTEHILKPILTSVISKSCAWNSTLPPYTEGRSDEQLMLALHEMLANGYPTYETLRSLALAVGLSIDQCIKPLVRHLLVKVSSPPEILDLVQSAQGSWLEDLEPLLPDLMQRRYLTFEDAEMMGIIFGFGPQSLGDADALAASAWKVAQQHNKASHLEQVKEVIVNVKKRGYPTHSEMQLIAGIFGLQPEMDEIMRQFVAILLPTFLREPQNALKLAMLKPLVFQMLERGYPTIADLKALADVFDFNLAEATLTLIDRTLRLSLHEQPTLVAAVEAVESNQLQQLEVPESLLAAEPGKVEMQHLRSLADTLHLSSSDFEMHILRPLVDATMERFVDGLESVVPRGHAPRSKIQQVSSMFEAMQERGYPVYTDIEVLAGLLGLDPMRDMLLPLLVRVLDIIGAPDALKQTVRSADIDRIQQESVPLKEALPSMLDRGYPVFSDFELIASALNLDLMHDIVRPLMISFLVRVGAPQSLLNAIEDFRPDEGDLLELKSLLPGALSRGYPSLSEVETLARIFDLDPLQDLLQPLVVAMLRKIGAPASVNNRVVQASLTQEHMTDVQTSVSSIRQRGYPSYEDVDVLTRVFNLDMMEDFLRPAILTVLLNVKAPQAVVDTFRDANMEEAKIDMVRSKLPEMMNRKYPTCSDVEHIADLFGKRADEHIFKPLLLAAFSRINAPKKVITLVGRLPFDCDRVEPAIAHIMRNGYPSFQDMKHILADSGLDVSQDILVPMAQEAITKQDSALGLAALRIQSLVQEGRALMDLSKSDSAKLAADLTTAVANLFNAVAGAVEGGEEQGREEFEQGTWAALESIGSPALNQVESFLSSKLENPAHKATSILGMSLGDGDALCEGSGVNTQFEIFLEGLSRIKAHPTITRLQSLADLLIDVADHGYVLLDAVKQIPALAEVAQSARKFEHLPGVGLLLKVIAEVGDRLSKTWKDNFQQPTNQLEDRILVPGTRLENRIHSGITMAVNTLEAVALTLSNLLRPPTSVFKDIANELQVCTLLETTTPLQDASGFLLRLLQAGAIPAYSVWPTDPFQGVSRFIHGAAANLKRVFSTIIRHLRAVLNFLDKEYKVCPLKFCSRITVAQLLQKSSKLLNQFGCVEQLDAMLQPIRNIKVMVSKALDGMSHEFISPDAVDFAPGARRLAGWTLKPSWDNLPDISAVAQNFQSLDLVEAVEQQQSSALEGCIFQDTGLEDEDWGVYAEDKYLALTPLFFSLTVHIAVQDHSHVVAHAW